MAQLYYSVPEEQRVDAIYEILQAVWTQGQDLSFKPHFNTLQRDLAIETLSDIDVEALLIANDQACAAKHQPDFPVLELRIEGKTYLFNSLYRVWMIESIFSNVLEQKYKSENQQERALQENEELDDEKRQV